MKKQVIASLALLYSVFASAQYKNDNVLYTTIDVSELCKTLAANPGYTLLDVRSRGEHYDSSQSVSLNIGKMKGARNISVQDLAQRIDELKDQRDQPIFIYCSHSQRSRRASKTLADSGFTKVYNINGGMTAIHASKDDCVQKLLESEKAYSVLAPAKVCELLKTKPGDIFLLDVRNDSAWDQISRFEKENGTGHLKGAVHIARKDIALNLASIPRDKQVIITDIGGVDPAFAAILLTKLGYTNVSVMLEGIDRFLLTDEKELPCRHELYESKAPYSIMNAFEFGQFVKQAKNYLLVDARSAEEFNNKHKDEFRNIGRINEAVNLPFADSANRIEELSAHKNKAVVVYGFSSGSEAYIVAKKLTDAGFKNVSVLIGGIFGIRWTAANRKDQSFLKELIVDVPEANQ